MSSGQEALAGESDLSHLSSFFIADTITHGSLEKNYGIHKVYEDEMDVGMREGCKSGMEKLLVIIFWREEQISKDLEE